MKVCVIGGGAAGLMAAYIAANGGNEVTLFEQNEKLGKKIYLTGKGRCNITNIAGIPEILNSVVRNPKFMFSALNQFSNEDLMKLCEDNGLELKTERGGRVFPKSDKSSDVIKMFEKLLGSVNVNVNLNAKITEIILQNGMFTGIKAQGKILNFDKCIVATGGLSYPKTGSCGDGFVFAKKLGINVTGTFPSLIPLTTNDKDICSLSGVTLKNVGFSLFQDDKKIYYEQGEMLFCHFGISGPIVLTASAYLNFPVQSAYAKIDLKPALSHEMLDKRILRDFEKNKNKEIKNALSELLISSLISIVLKKSNIDPQKKVNEITAVERSRLKGTLKSLEFDITGTRKIDEAIITRGGIDVLEINAKTMESKKIKGLYFAGEMLDVDAKTGGYNLQIAFSTGYVAGKLN